MQQDPDVRVGQLEKFRNFTSRQSLHVAKCYDCTLEFRQFAYGPVNGVDHVGAGETSLHQLRERLGRLVPHADAVKARARHGIDGIDVDDAVFSRTGLLREIDGNAQQPRLERRAALEPLGATRTTSAW